MNSAVELLYRCRGAGLRLRAEGERLLVRPVRLASPGLLAELRECKAELLLLLGSESSGVPADCLAWVPTASQVVAGEFDGGPRSLLESLLIGVRGIQHPLCQKARARLETLLGPSHKESPK